MVKARGQHLTAAPARWSGRRRGELRAMLQSAATAVQRGRLPMVDVVLTV